MNKTKLQAIQTPCLDTPRCQEMIKQGLVITFTERPSFVRRGKDFVKQHVVVSSMGLALGAVMIFSVVGPVQNMSSTRNTRSQAREILSQLDADLNALPLTQQIGVNQNLGVDTQALVAEALRTDNAEVTGQRLVEVAPSMPRVVVQSNNLSLASAANPAQAHSPYAQVNLEPELMLVRDIQFTASSGELVTLSVDRTGRPVGVDVEF